MARCHGVVGGPVRKSAIILVLLLIAGLAVSTPPASALAGSVVINEVMYNPESDRVNFAVIGDYGSGNAAELAVSQMVKGWNPDFIATVGDNVYSGPSADGATALENKVGAYYQEYIYPYSGIHGTGSPTLTNRFYPALGNHDWGEPGTALLTCPAGVCEGPWLDFFNLPNNERYYDVRDGPVHLFVVDDYYREPDGHVSTSAQAAWLQAELAASDAQWKIVLNHFPPYASLDTPPTGYTSIRWPFASWGADMVISGHKHWYERLDVGGITYFVNGLGGQTPYNPETPHPGSQATYNASHGAMRISASATQLTTEFVATNGTVIDPVIFDDGSDPTEFIELHNPGDTDVSLLGMSFTSGVGGTFGDVTLHAGEYLIVSPSISAAEAEYGITPAMQYTGGLSNTGETITLTAANGTTVVDSVTYDDVAPWPVLPASGVHSIELIDPPLDNALPTTWRVSTNTDGSPGANNNPGFPLTVLATPCALHDSRTSTGADAGPIVADSIRTVQVTGSLPATQGVGTAQCVPADATAVVFTISALDPTGAGNLRLSRAGAEADGGVVNYTANGLSNANTVTVPISAEGAVDIYANTAPSDVRLVALGYHSPSGILSYTPLVPCTVADSRASGLPTADYLGPFAAGAAYPDIDVVGTFPAGQGSNGVTDCGVPAGADAVALNLVAIAGTGGEGFLATATGGLDPFEAVTHFADVGLNNATFAIVAVSASGTISIDIESVSGTPSTHVRAVVLGYLDETGTNYNPLTACTGFDTRPGQGAGGSFGGLRVAGTSTTYQIAGTIPANQGGAGASCGVPPGAAAVLINLVAIQPGAIGNFQAFATGSSPTGGVLNFAPLTPAMNNSNAVVVPLSALGQLDLHTNAPLNSGNPTVHARGVILGYYS